MCIHIQSRGFRVADHRAALEAFGNSSYRYQGQELSVRYADWNDPGTLILSDHAEAGDVRLTPRLCGSFAIWPGNGGDWVDMDACANDILRPQFVFLALNWSGDIWRRHSREDGTVAGHFHGLQDWCNFHNVEILKDYFECSKVVNPLRGGYMTDFVKGLVSGDSRKMCRMLREERISGQPLFEVCVEILQNELDALDVAFGNPDVPKYLIVFGRTIYEELGRMARRICGCETLGDLFPGRTIIRTGAFYGGRWQPEREEHLALMRQLHCLREDGNPVDISDIELVQ